MTTTTPETITDADLVALTRTGNSDAYGDLFRRHQHVARRYAIYLGRIDDADDVVSEAFARVLSLLQRGKGPTDNVSAYILTAVRHEVFNRGRDRLRVKPIGSADAFDQPVEHDELAGSTRAALRAALDTIPGRQQDAVWQGIVLGRPASEIAPEFGLTTNAMSALIYRGRTALRDAYLDQGNTR